MTYRRTPGYYLPADGYLWDPWFHRAGAVIHLYHLLQRTPSGLCRTDDYPRDRPVIAHATWTEDGGWEPRGTAVDYTGTPYDEDRIHTGCVVEHEGAFAMLYSGSNRVVCLAHSLDLDHWWKDDQNPLLAPDPALYLDRWRDPWVCPGLTGRRYTMVLAAQHPSSSKAAVGAVAAAHSDDLRTWVQDSSLQIPPWFQWLEVPEIHELEGTWHLLFATRRRWITAEGALALRARGLPAADGAYCLTAPAWRGPYESIASLGVWPGRYTTRLFCATPTDRWLWSHVEHDSTGKALFGLQPPRSWSGLDPR